MKIGIVLPSRNRPAGLKRSIASLLDHAAKPDRVTIFVGLDNDDPTLAETDNLPANCERVIRAPEITCAKMIDNLSAYAEERSDIVMRMDDDLVMTTGNWDRAVEECIGPYGIWHPDDSEQSGKGFCSLAAMSSHMAKWLREQQGFVHAPFFPFWFTDTWNDEIGDMAGMKAELPIKVSPPDGRGKTHGLRDIAFWAHLFNSFRTQRAEVASRLIDAAYPNGILKASARCKLAERERICEIKTENLSTPQFIAKWQSRAETFSEAADARYRKARAEAEAILSQFRVAA